MTKTELTNTRHAEFAAAKAASRSALEAYWAGSATASVLRDYQAGRVTTVKAGR
jgi:hypothetical protein